MQYTYRTKKAALQADKYWRKNHKTKIIRNKRKGKDTFTLVIN